MYKRIFDSGIYSESWCNGIIVHIHKKGHKNDLNNHRRIMLISAFAKLFLIVLRNLLNSWLENNDNFNDFQFGFRDGRSTFDCILYYFHSCSMRLKIVPNYIAHSYILKRHLIWSFLAGYESS